MLRIANLTYRIGARVLLDEVDATIRATQPGLFDRIALPPERLARQLLELAPVERGDAVEPGSRIE